MKSISCKNFGNSTRQQNIIFENVIVSNFIIYCSKKNIELVC